MGIPNPTYRPRTIVWSVVIAGLSAGAVFGYGVFSIIDGFSNRVGERLAFSIYLIFCGASLVCAATLIGVLMRSTTARALLTALTMVACAAWICVFIIQWEWVWLGVKRMVDRLLFTSPCLLLIVSTILLWLPGNRSFFSPPPVPAPRHHAEDSITWTFD